MAVAATFVFFLLFAQFAFLDWLQHQLREPGDVERAMVAMGLSGLATSFAAAWWLRRIPARRLLTIGFLGCAATALLSLIATARVPLMIVATATGAATAVITVALASDLRGFLPGPRFGWRVGVGTGVAYAICNLPPIFAAPPRHQAIIAAIVCLLAWGILRRYHPDGDPSRPGPCPLDAPFSSFPALARGDFRGLGFLSMVLSFLALIWMDSAAFAVIQENATLKATTWHGPSRQLVQGTTHLIAALVAGLLIDRGHFRSLLLAAFGLFAVSFSALGAHPQQPSWAGPLYAIGISFYSVALVAYPAYRGREAGTVPRRWRAGAVFGVAGWLGSALGVGMAQDLHHIPRLFILLTGIGLSVAWLLAHADRVVRLARAHLLTLGMAAGVGAVVMVSHAIAVTSGNPTDGPSGGLGVSPDETTAARARGRQVYIQEGCINCHSQYARARGSDAAWFGPHRPIERAQTPPLIGNRRQGPDLTNIGTRRSPTWQRLHLGNPRALAPASRMPAYAHLFAADDHPRNHQSDQRGEDLVAYLDSLGREQRSQWAAQTRNVPMTLGAGDPQSGGRLFSRLCAACHGEQARGDGIFAPAMSSTVARRAMDLRKGPFWSISWGPDSEPQRQAIARLIRFGIPGTDMPGHEYAPTRDLRDLTAFIEALVALPPLPPLDPTANRSAYRFADTDLEVQE